MGLVSGCGEGGWGSGLVVWDVALVGGGLGVESRVNSLEVEMGYGLGGWGAGVAGGLA